MATYSTRILFLASAVLVSCQDHPAATATASTAQAPPAAVARPYTAQDFDTVQLVLVAVPTQHISLERPVRWLRTTASGLWAYQMPCADSAAFCANPVVSSIARKPSIALATYADQLASQPENRADITNFQLLNRSPRTLNGLAALIIDYKATTQGHETGSTTVLLAVGTQVAILNFVASNDPPKSYVRHRGLFERIIQSVQPAYWPTECAAAALAATWLNDATTPATSARKVGSASM